MGLSSSKSTTRSNSTTTPQVPSWISGPTQTVMGGVNSLIGQTPTPTPISSLQTQAFNGGANLSLADPTASAQGATRSLLNYTPSNVTAGSLAGIDLSPYMNPYTDSVVNTTLADLAHARDIGINSNSSAATLGSGATGWAGARAGVADANTNDDFMRTFATTAAGLRQGAFTNAQQAALNDINNKLSADEFNTNAGLTGANLRLGAANQLGNESLAGQDSIRQNLGLMGDLGTQQHEAEQEQNPQNVQMTYLSNLLRLIQGANPALYTGSNSKGTSTTTSSPSLLDSIGSLVQTLGQVGSIPGFPKI